MRALAVLWLTLFTTAATADDLNILDQIDVEAFLENLRSTSPIEFFFKQEDAKPIDDSLVQWVAPGQYLYKHPTSGKTFELRVNGLSGYRFDNDLELQATTCEVPKRPKCRIEFNLLVPTIEFREHGKGQWQPVPRPEYSDDLSIVEALFPEVREHFPTRISCDSWAWAGRRNDQPVHFVQIGSYTEFGMTSDFESSFSKQATIVGTTTYDPKTGPLVIKPDPVTGMAIHFLITSQPGRTLVFEHKSGEDICTSQFQQNIPDLIEKANEPLLPKFKMPNALKVRIQERVAKDFDKRLTAFAIARHVLGLNRTFGNKGQWDYDDNRFTIENPLLYFLRLGTDPRRLYGEGTKRKVLVIDHLAKEL